MDLIQLYREWHAIAARYQPLQASAASLLLAVLIALLIRIFTSSSSQPIPIPYSVPPPQPTSTSPPSSSPNGPIPCYAPSTGQFLGLTPAHTPTSIDAAISSASHAQLSWRLTSFSQRKAVLRTLSHFILTNAHQICSTSSLDSGKTLVDAHLGEILTTLERISWTLSHGEAALRPSPRPTSLLMSHKRNSVHYEPLGVVAALVSWNYPFHNLVAPIISAIFAGNAILVKVSEHTAWSAPYFLNIVRGALTAHGHDPSLVQAIACWPDAAAHLSRHPGIAHLTFIGSRPVAHRVAAAAAQALTPLVVELGGKDPFIVLDSAANDLLRIVEIILRGTFQASGQNCVGIERVIASRGVYDRLVEMLTPRVSSLTLGPEADVGAMISSASFDRLEERIVDAVAAGARLLVGGKRYVHDEFPAGHYFQPTLLVDVTPEMQIAQHECFAPILTLMRAASSSPEDVLSIANAPDFGLGASVHAAESDPNLRPIVAGLKAGMVAVNDFAAYYAVQLPFGGVAGSGYGRFAGEEGLRGLCNVKAVCEDRFGWLGIRTAIPPPVRYPVQDQNRGWRFTQAVVELGYGSLGTKISALIEMIKNL